MDVVRDVLDKSVVDRNGREMGRADGIVLGLREGQAPLLQSILIGPTVLGDRLHPIIGRFVRALERRLGLAAGRPVSVTFDDIEKVGRHVMVRLAVGDTAVEAVERRLRAWILALPGGR